jgi:chorismate dehydratase
MLSWKKRFRRSLFSSFYILSFLCVANLIQLKKIKIGAVSYLNTKPFIYGMQGEDFLNSHELLLAYPSKLSGMLAAGELDVALVPAALLTELKSYNILTNYCIGANKEVGSVCVFSEKPLNQVKRIYLDYQSKSSVALLKVLLLHFWKIEIPFVASHDDAYINEIGNESAGLVIGDRALHIGDRFAYRYDLAEVWNEMTGLPFVFAVWVSLKPMDENWINQFSGFIEIGLEHIDEIAAGHENEFSGIRKYYNENISYRLTDKHREGLSLFCKLLSEFPPTENI